MSQDDGYDDVDEDLRLDDREGDKEEMDEELQHQADQTLVPEPGTDTLTIATEVLLHVVYSGRGDAFYVTWRAQDGRPHMIMVDGGPYKYDANKGGGAPYWEYLAWAGRRIWSDFAANEPFKVDLVLNTHPHDDHIGGLVQWLATPPGSTAAGVFPPCPIVLPAFYSHRSQIELIYKQTIAKHWTASTHAEYTGDVVPPDGVLLKYPDAKHLVVFSPPQDNGNPPHGGVVQPFQEILDQYFTDVKDEEDLRLEKDLNYASLLLKSSFATGQLLGNPVPSRMFITGDNDGKIIMPYVKGEQLSIYKIQHHGSRFENMGRKVPSIPSWFRAETALLFTLLFKYRHNQDIRTAQPCYTTYLLPVELQHLPPTGQHDDNAPAGPPSKQGLLWIANQFELFLQLKYGVNDMPRYIQVLIERHNKFRSFVQEGKLPPGLRGSDAALHPHKLCHGYNVIKKLWDQLIDWVSSWGKIDYVYTADDGEPDEEFEPKDRTPTTEKEQSKEDERDRDRSRERADSQDGDRRRRRSRSNDRESDRQKEEARKKRLARLKKQLQMFEPPEEPETKPEREKKQKPRQIHYFYGIQAGRKSNRSGGVGVPDPLPWWARWATLKTGGKWDNLLGDVLRVQSTKEFFDSFDAETYVVSANSRHGHPTPSCLLGLSLALEEKRDKAIAEGRAWQTRELYLTSPKSFPRPGLEQLHRVRSGQEPTVLLSTAMTVHYLAGETYMSLRAQSLAGADNMSRAVNTNTVKTLPMDNYHAEYNSLSSKMEGGLPVEPQGAEYGEMYYSIYTSNPRRYVTYQKMAESGGKNPLELTLKGGNAAEDIQKFQIRYPAPTDNASWGSSKQSSFKMQLRFASAIPPQEYTVRVGERSYSPADGTRGWELRWEMPDTSKLMVFRNGEDALQEWKKKDANNAYVIFYIEQVAAPAVTTTTTQMLVFRQPNTSMMMMTRNSMAKSLRVAAQSTVEPWSHVEIVSESSPSLRDYLHESPLELAEGYKAREVLSGIVRKRNFQALDLSLDYQSKIMGYEVDPEESRVDYTGNDLLRGFNAAMIVLKVPDDASITLNKDRLKIKAAQLRIRWKLDLTLAVETYIFLEKDNLICSGKTISGAMGTPSLAKVLDHMGIPSPISSQMRLPQLLGVLVRDEGRIRRLLANQLPTFFISAGIATIKPDLDLSTATISYLPGGEVFVEQATVICRLTGVQEWMQNFSIAGVALKISNLTVRANNSGPATQRLVFQGEAGFQAEGATVKLAARYTIGEEDEPELLFLLQGGGGGRGGSGGSLDDITKQLPNMPDFSSMAIPMSENLTLSSLSDGMSAIGFSVQQPVARIPSYVVTSLFATVNFADWKEYLPSGLVSTILGDAAAKVIIRHPLDAQNRGIAVGVSFKIPVPVTDTDTESKTLTLGFSAEPLPEPTAHQYRLAASVTDNGLSIGEAIRALGLETLSSDTLAAFPALQDLVLEHVFVKSLSIGVDHKAKALSVADWAGEFWIDTLNCIIPSDVISVQDISLSISRTGDSLRCSASARIDLPLVDKLVNVAFQPPTAELSGYLLLDAPYGLSIADVLYSFDLPACSKVPIVKDLLKTELESARLDLGVLDNGKSWTVYGGESTIHLPDTLVGELSLSEARVFLRYNRANDPAGPGKERVLLTLTANAFHEAVAATLTYDSFKGRLAASLVPTRDLPLAEPLDALLPATLRDAISPVVGGLKLKGAALSMATRRPYSVRMFRLLLKDDSEVEVDFWQLKSLYVEYQAASITDKPEKEKENEKPSSDTHAGGDAVGPQQETSSEPQTESRQPPTSADEPEGQQAVETPSENPPGPEATSQPEVSQRPTKLTVVGVVSKGDIAARIRVSFVRPVAKETGEQELSISAEPAEQGRLTARGFLTLLGITDEKLPIEEPAECPPVFDVMIERASGTVSCGKDTTTNKSNLALKKFRFIARSTGKVIVFASPEVSLDSIRADIRYDKVLKEDGTREGVISGFIEGHIEICGVHLWAKYVSDKVTQQSRFTALMTADKFSPAHTAIGFDGLGKAVQIPEHEWAVPPDLGVPEDLKVTAVGANFIPGQCLEVFARGTEIWTGRIAGLQLEVKSLTALMRRKTALENETQAVKAAYEVFLKGELVFEGFVSAQAWLYLSKSKNSTLTAVLTRAKLDGENELEGIANKMALDNEAASWGALLPKPDIPVQFDKTSLFLQIDFTTPKFVILGNMQGVGSALLVGTKDDKTSQHQFALFIEVRDLSQLWSSTASDVGEQFDIEKVSVTVVNFDTDIDGLRKLLTLQKPENAAKERSLDKGKLPEGEPPTVPKTPGAISVSESTTKSLPKTTQIGKGAWFFLTVSLGHSQRPMTETVSFGLESKDRATMTLYAAMTADKSARHYMVDVRNLTLLGGCVEINGSGEYRPGEDGMLDVKGDLSLHGLRDDPIVFEVRLEKRRKYTHFEMAVTATAAESDSEDTLEVRKPEVKNPFHPAFPVTLKDLRISGTIEYSEEEKRPLSQYTVSGAAQFELQGHNKALIDASIVFREGKPSAVVLKYQPTDQVSTSELCSSLIQPESAKAAVWRSDEYDDFELKAVTAVYLKEEPALKVDNTTYSPGLSVAANISLFQHNFEAMLRVDLERKGFALEATYLDGIDLFFAKLGKTGDISGPTVKIRAFSGEKISFGLASGLTLFGVENLWLDLDYQPAKDPKERYFKGRAGYKGEILGKKDPALGIEYKKGQWGFSGWEVFQEMSNDDLPLEKVIERGSTKGDCGAIVKLLWKTAVTTKFRFEIGLPTDEQHKCTKDELWGTIKWWYNIKFLDQEITDLKLPEIDLRMKAPFTLDAMKTKLFDIILDEKNWASIGESLMDRPADFARLMGAVAFEKVGEDAIAKLLCRGKDYEDADQGARNRAKDINNKKIEALELAVEAAVSAATAAVGAVGVGVGVVAGGIVAAVEAVPVIIGLILVLAAGVGAVIGAKAGQYLDLENALYAAAELAAGQLERLAKLISAATERLELALVLSANPVAWFVEGEDDASKIEVSWDTALPNTRDQQGNAFDYADFNDVTWRVAYSSSPVVDKTSLIHTASKFRDSAFNPEWTFSDVVYVAVKARLQCKDQVFEAASWTTVAVRHRPAPWLRPPIGLGFAVSEMNCSLVLPPTLQDIGMYELWLTNPEQKAANSFHYQNRILKTTAGPETINIPLATLGPDPKGFNSIQARVRQISSDPNVIHDSPWFFGTDSYLLQAAVTNLAARLIDGRVTVSWEQSGTPAVNDYAVQVLRQDDSLARLEDVQQLPGTENERSMSFSDTEFHEGEQITIAVQARPASGNVLSLVATKDLVISRPPIPRILDETTWDATSNTLILVVWCRVYMANTSLNVQISREAAEGERIAFVTVKRPLDSIIQHRAWVRLDLAAFGPGLDLRTNHGYQVQVSTECADQTRSAASEPWTLPIVPPSLELSDDFGVAMLLDGSVKLHWPAGGAGTWRYVRLEHETKLTAIVEKEWPAEADGPKIPKEESGGLVVGTRISVFRMTKAERVVGYKQRTWMTLTQEQIQLPQVVEAATS